MNRLIKWWLRVKELFTDRKDSYWYPICPRCGGKHRDTRCIPWSTI